MNSDSKCILCNEKLVPVTGKTELACAYCGKSEAVKNYCIQGHYICSSCYDAEADELILRTCLAAESTDPFQIAGLLMKHPAIHLRGSEHHFLVPATLLAAYYNAIRRSEELPAQLREALKRSKSLPSAYCGYHGVCGAADGAGIFMSLILHSTPLSVKGWRHRTGITAGSLQRIADEGDPRCCKRNTYLTLGYAVHWMQTEYNIPMGEVKEISCIHIEPNRECLKSNCRFYQSAGTPRPPHFEKAANHTQG